MSDKFYGFDDPDFAVDDDDSPGCCGRELSVDGEIWCNPCKLHVADCGPLDKRTYFARTGESCPFQNQAKNFGLA